MKCDFCSDRHPIYRYPVHEGTDWSACQECALLIDAEDLNALCRRILNQLVGHAAPRALLDAELVAAMSIQLGEWVHLTFWSQRDGPGLALIANQIRRCPRCGWVLSREAPDGPCPRCLRPARR